MKVIHIEYEYTRILYALVEIEGKIERVNNTVYHWLLNKYQ